MINLKGWMVGIRDYPSPNRMDPQTLCLTRQAASLFMIQKALNLLQRLVVEFMTLWDNEGLSVNVVLY